MVPVQPSGAKVANSLRQPRRSPTTEFPWMPLTPGFFESMMPGHHPPVFEPSGPAPPMTQPSAAVFTARDLEEARAEGALAGEVRVLKWAAGIAIVAIIGALGLLYQHQILLHERVTRVEERLVQVEDRLVKVEDRLVKVEDRLVKVEDRLTRVEDRVARVEEQIVVINKQLATISSQLAILISQQDQPPQATR